MRIFAIRGLGRVLVRGLSAIALGGVVGVVFDAVVGVLMQAVNNAGAEALSEAPHPAALGGFIGGFVGFVLTVVVGLIGVSRPGRAVATVVVIAAFTVVVVLALGIAAGLIGTIPVSAAVPFIAAVGTVFGFVVGALLVD